MTTTRTERDSRPLRTDAHRRPLGGEPIEPIRPRFQSVDRRYHRPGAVLHGRRGRSRRRRRPPRPCRPGPRRRSSNGHGSCSGFARSWPRTPKSWPAWSRASTARPWPKSRASIHRGVEVVEFACGVPSLIMGQSLANIARQVDCETIRHPVGVCAGITPFNFPAMVPLWMFPIAIVCGNTFVLEAVGEGPAVGGPAGRAADGVGVARGRLQHRARRQGMRRCAA